MAVIASIEDLKRLHRARVPRMFYDYAESGSYTEQTFAENCSDFAKIRLRQKVRAGGQGVDAGEDAGGLFPVALVNQRLPGQVSHEHDPALKGLLGGMDMQGERRDSRRGHAMQDLEFVADLVIESKLAAMIDAKDEALRIALNQKIPVVFPGGQKADFRFAADPALFQQEGADQRFHASAASSWARI